MTTRIEKDPLGEKPVPAEALYGIQTVRAVENFPISGLRPLPAFVDAVIWIKRSAALTHKETGRLDPKLADAIVQAADEILAGKHRDQFVVDVYQAGAGTSHNMNCNEVLANRANELLGGARGSYSPVHPNDHVNASQSSNDVFPSAIHLAATEAVVVDLVPAIRHLVKSLRRKQREFKAVVKSGRTHLMDATPVTLGQEFGGYAAQVEDAIARLEAALPRVGELPLGGTAVGTGINAPKTFARSVIRGLATRTGLPLTEARDHFAAQGARDALIELSGVLRTFAVSLVKIANDLRWMGSGPRAGLAEIFIPDLQPGSSIMPGKVNPVIPEAVTQVAAQVFGNDAAIAFGGSQGNFELNVYMPMMARNLLESLRLLTNVSRVFADKCIDGIEANVTRCKEYAESSPSIGTSLNPYIGYEAAGKVIKESVKTGKSIRQIVLAKKLMTAEELDRALDVEAMTRGGIIH